MNRTTIIYIILLAILGLRIIYLYQTDITLQAKILQLDRCRLPCWIGITPGQTSLREARNLVIKTYSNPEYYELLDRDFWFEIKSKSTNAVLRVVFIALDGKLTEDKTIDIIELQSAIPIVEVYERVGAPDSVILWGRGGGTFPSLLYKRFKTIIVIDDPNTDFLSCTKLGLAKTTQVLTLYAEMPPVNYWGRNLPQAWHGFHKCYIWKYGWHGEY